MAATQKCRHCQSEIDAKATTCPQCRKRARGVGCFGAIFIVVIAFFGIVVIASMFPSDTPERTNRSQIGAALPVQIAPTLTWRVTTAELAQLREGMTLDEVRQALHGLPNQAMWENDGRLNCIWANPIDDKPGGRPGGAELIWTAFRAETAERFVLAEFEGRGLQPALP